MMQHPQTPRKTVGVNHGGQDAEGVGLSDAWRDQWSDAARYPLSRAFLTTLLIVRDHLLSQGVAQRGGCSWI